MFKETKPCNKSQTTASTRPSSCQQQRNERNCGWPWVRNVINILAQELGTRMTDRLTLGRLSPAIEPFMSLFEKQHTSGYWGPATSSVDWCEQNYKYSFYIAELWNTLSSFAMIGVGLLGTLMHHRTLGWRLSNGYLMIIIVGIGSVLFHGTLQYEHQMWDEVPMVWTACYMLWILLQDDGYEPIRYGIGITLYCALATFVTSQYQGSTQFYLFQASFGLVMWSCLWFVWKLYKKTQNTQVIQLFHQGAQFLVLAIGVWLFDSNLCFLFNYVPNPQFHAWWHVLVCISIHFFFVVTGFEMMGTKHHRIAYYAKWIPYVQLIDGASSVTADKTSS